MSLTAIFISAAALLVGVGVGYYLRLIISLGKKGSMELEIKQMMLGAKEEAQRVVDDAKKKAEEVISDAQKQATAKEEELKQTEHRLIKKDELLDARQVEIDKEIENIKIKVEDVKKIKERVDGMASEKEKELEELVSEARAGEIKAFKQLVALLQDLNDVPKVLPHLNRLLCLV